MTPPNPRQTHALIAASCGFLIAAALYLQHVLGMQPCPLCISQRIMVIVSGVIALLACLHNPGSTGIRLYAALGALASLGGLGFAGRHVWLQSLPEDQVPACGPGLTYMFENFPVTEAFQLLLLGDGNCAKPDLLLGVSLAVWTLLAFAGLLCAWLFQLLRKAS